MAKSSRFILVIDADGKPARQEISKLTDSVKQADNETKAFGSGGQLDGLVDDLGDVDLSVRGVTNALTGKNGASVAALGLAGGLFAAAKSAADAAVEVDVLATALNTDIETASRLAAVFERVGIETNDIADIGLQIAGALSDDVELAERLGLTLGQAKNPVTALKAGIDNWDFLNATERASVFGEEGVRQISAIVAEGGDLQTMLDEVGEANVFTAEDAAEARELNLQIAKMEEEFKGLALSIGKEVIPAVADFTGGLREVVAGPGNKGWSGWGSEVTGFFKDYGKAIYDPLYSFKELKKAVTGAGDEIEEVGTVTDELRQRIEKVGPASARAIKAESKRWKALADAATEALDKVDAELNESRTGALSDWKKELEVEDQAERLEAAMTAAFGGTKKEVRTAKDEAIRFLESIEDLPAETILDVKADFDEGSLAEAYSALDAIRREAGLPIPLGRYVPPTAYGPGPDGGPAFYSSPAATNLTVNMPRSATPRSVGQQVDQWRRVNG
jgi:hypothetical protein